MTKQEFGKKYVGKKIAVHCNTEEKANEFLALAHTYGYKWRSGHSYLEYNNWQVKEEETCYYLDCGEYAGLQYFKDYCYKIIEYGGADMKYKVGDRVLIRKDLKDGCFYGNDSWHKIEMGHTGEVLTISDDSNGFYQMEGSDYSWTDEMIERGADMTKSDLKEGMVVRYRDGRIILVENSNLHYFNDDLDDIVFVYSPIWERKEEPKEMTVAEISEKLGYEVKVVR